MEERTLPRYPAGKRELIFGLLVLLFGTFTWNSILYGGFCLGFALGAVVLPFRLHHGLPMHSKG